MAGYSIDFAEGFLAGARLIAEIAAGSDVVWLLMVDGPLTSKEIAVATNTCHTTAKERLSKLRLSRHVRIVDWRKAEIAGRWAPLYGLGGEPDAQMPKPKPKRSKEPERAMEQATWCSVLF